MAMLLLNDFISDTKYIIYYNLSLKLHNSVEVLLASFSEEESSLREVKLTTFVNKKS